MQHPMREDQEVRSPTKQPPAEHDSHAGLSCDSERPGEVISTLPLHFVQIETIQSWIPERIFGTKRWRTQTHSRLSCLIALSLLPYRPNFSWTRLWTRLASFRFFLACTARSASVTGGAFALSSSEDATHPMIRSVRRRSFLSQMTWSARARRDALCVWCSVKLALSLSKLPLCFRLNWTGCLRAEISSRRRQLAGQ